MKKVLPALSLSLWAGLAHAQTTGTGSGTGNFVDALQLLINVSESFPAIQYLILTITIFIGVYFVGMALWDMYYVSSGQLPAGRTPPTSSGVTTQLIIGGVLASSAYWMYIAGNTLVGTSANTTAMLYGGTTNLYCDKARFAIFFFIAIVGQIAFLRGWMAINQYMNNRSQGGLGMGFTFIIGGTACYFLADLSEILSEWFGVSVNMQMFCS